MADSDNSTTLPFVTRRKILTGSAAAVGTLGFDAFAENRAEIETSSDPVLSLWHDWQDAHLSMENHGRRSQSLEQQLAETVDYPCAIIALPDGERVAAYSVTAIRDIFDGFPDEAAACATAETELAAHQTRWDEADREIGYSATLKAEHAAGERAASILDMMADTPTTSFVGIEAKLDAMLREGNVWEDCSEFPWPQIRSVLNDVIRMRQHCANGSVS